MVRKTFGIGFGTLAVSLMALPGLSSAFPYETSMVDRFRSDSVEVDSFEVPVQVSKVGDGMPNDNTVVESTMTATHIEAIAHDDWEVVCTGAGNGIHGALALLEKADGTLAWMGFSGGVWTELTGVTPEEGVWDVKVDFDYSDKVVDPNGMVKVRYSIRKTGSDSGYVSLGGGWQTVAAATFGPLTGIDVYGSVTTGPIVAKSGSRPAEGAVVAVKDVAVLEDRLDFSVSVANTWGVSKVEVELKEAPGGTPVVKAMMLDASGTTVFAPSFEVVPGAVYTYAIRLNGISYGGIELVKTDSGTVTAELVKPTVDESKREIVANINSKIPSSVLEHADGTTYSISGKGHIKWADTSDKYATLKGGVLTVRAGVPANGLESFDSYALGLDPTVTLAKPAAVVKEGGMQSATGVTVHVPNVKAENLPDSGIEVFFQRQKSTDKGLTWMDDGAAVPVGGELTIPFTPGTLYRVNTVLK